MIMPKKTLNKNQTCQSDISNEEEKAQLIEDNLELVENEVEDNGEEDLGVATKRQASKSSVSYFG